MKLQKIYQTNSEEETIDLAKKIFLEYKNKKIFFLLGDIGSGKTVFARAIAEELKVKFHIKSPSFSFKNVYPNFIHYDLYQASKAQFNQLKFNLFEEAENNYVLIEWADLFIKIDELLKIIGAINIKINIEKDNSRLIYLFY